MVRAFVLVVGFVLVLSAGCSDDNSAPAAVTPSPIATSTATASPAATVPPAAADITTLSFAASVPSVPNTVMFTVSGCFQCDGPDTAVQRHTTGPDGKLKSETILESGKGALSGYALGLAGADSTGSTLWAVACKTAYCGGLGLHPRDTWRVYWSFDGGATWAVAYEMGVEFLSVSSASGKTLAVTSVTPGGPPSPQRYFLVDENGATEVSPPAAAGAFPTPIVLTGGRLIWAESSNDQDGGRRKLFATDGSVLLTSVEQMTYDSAVQRPDGSLMVGTFGSGSYGLDIYPGLNGPESTTFGPAPFARWRLRGAYRFAGSDRRYVLANATGDAFGLNDTATSYPVLIDLDGKTATPITADVFTQQRGRNRFIAMTRLP